MRLQSLPNDLRQEMRTKRKAKDWSQLELAQKAGLSQRHISGIETGKIVPRYDTLLEILRVLDLDLILVPREILSAVQALIRDHRNRAAPGHTAERARYAAEEGEEDEETPNG
ncbi:MAG: helix-turn-helix domain-containing protein [Burkholderiales bacterium]